MAKPHTIVPIGNLIKDTEVHSTTFPYYNKRSTTNFPVFSSLTHIQKLELQCTVLLSYQEVGFLTIFFFKFSFNDYYLQQNTSECRPRSNHLHLPPPYIITDLIRVGEQYPGSVLCRLLDTVPHSSQSQLFTILHTPIDHSNAWKWYQFGCGLTFTHFYLVAKSSGIPLNKNGTCVEDFVLVNCNIKVQ